uniref:Uncharacterized protein n=1 Tax=Plectus sambesii TaxID=2011161 RepID=A0A914WZD1_9BILA
MPSSDRRGAPGNLLMESPSDSDVPDLELITPTKPRRKKLFSKKFSSRMNIKGGDGQGNMQCSSSCAMGCLLFSLVLGLVVLACFTLSLCNELNSLKENVAGRLHSLDSFQTTIDELRTELKQCCTNSSSSAKTAENAKADNKDAMTLDASSTARTNTDHSSNTALDTNSNNQLKIADDVAQLASATSSLTSRFQKTVQNITMRLDSLEAKCSTVCHSSTTPTIQTDKANGHTLETAKSNNTPTLLPTAPKRRRSDVGTSQEYFQFVRKP